MNGRLRFFAALLALLALTAAFAEQLWASTCAPEEAVHSMKVHESGAIDEHRAHPSGPSVRKGDADPARAPGHPASCPVASVTMSGCVLLALPGHATPLPAGFDSAARPAIPPPTLVGSIWTVPHFHPPRR